MAIVRCPECAKKLKVADTSVGKKVKCTCGVIFVAEEGDAAPAPAAPVDKVLVACTECSAPLKVSAGSLGKRVKCPKCGGTFIAAAEKANTSAKPAAKAPAPPPPEPEFGFKDDEVDEEKEAPRSQKKRRDDDEEDEVPKAKSKPKGRSNEDDDDKSSEPAEKPKSRLVLNLIVALLVLGYAGFFAAVYFKVIELNLPHSGTGAFRPNKVGQNVPPKIEEKKDDDNKVDPKKKGEEIKQPELIDLPKKNDPIPPKGDEKKIEEKKIEGDEAAAAPVGLPAFIARIEPRRTADFACAPFDRAAAN